MLLIRPLKDVGPWRGIFEPSTATSFTERERVGLRSMPVCYRTMRINSYVLRNYYDLRFFALQAMVLFIFQSCSDRVLYHLRFSGCIP